MHILTLLLCFFLLLMFIGWMSGRTPPPAGP